jgi:hypothetical protein
VQRRADLVEQRRTIDEWLLQGMAQCDFFAFGRPGHDRELSNWFLASRPHGFIISVLHRSASQFWGNRTRTARVYHWQQYLFEYLLRTSLRFRREWRKAPRISAVPLLLLQEKLALRAPVSEDERQLFRALPMHKLSHKRDLDLDWLAEFAPPPKRAQAA